MGDAKADSGALLRVLIEPDEPIEVKELSLALASLSRQYERVAEQAGYTGKAAEARLMVAAVAPGSIEIHLAPHLVLAGPLFAGLIPHAEVLLKFVGEIGELFNVFRRKEPGRPVELRDCEDVGNIVAPIAHHGGQQSITVVNIDNYAPTLVMDQGQAREILETAGRERKRLSVADLSPRQRVSMIWKRLDRDKAKTTGKRSPDLGLIEEIDPDPHAVLFTDELSYLKDEMIGDEENPLRKVYYVDVEVSTAGGKVTAYRVVGYHGSDDYDGSSSSTEGNGNSS